ncbi:MAG: hypothetical protein ABI863_13385 [Ginsengibacter sp.]
MSTTVDGLRQGWYCVILKPVLKPIEILKPKIYSFAETDVDTGQMLIVSKSASPCGQRDGG